MSMAYVSLAAVPLSTIGLFDLFAGSTLPVFAGVLTRIAGILLGGGMRLFPGGTIHLRLGLLPELQLEQFPESAESRSRTFVGNFAPFCAAISIALL